MGLQAIEPTRSRTTGWGGVPATVALSVCLVAFIIVSITFGRYELDVVKVMSILIDNVLPVETRNWTTVEEQVVELVRLPRILAAVLVGAGLAASGAALQGLFRNPLVDPNIIGVTSGAGFGGTLAILAGLFGYALLGIAFLFGLGSVILVKALASARGRTSILALVLAGVIVSAFFASAISIAKLLADPQQKLPAITYWLMGSLASTNYDDLIADGAGHRAGDPSHPSAAVPDQHHIARRGEGAGAGVSRRRPCSGSFSAQRR